LVVGGVLAASLAALSSTGVQAQAVNDVPLFPAPGVPVQQHPAVAMTCIAGQTDINHATVEQIATGLGVARPIAQRVVEHRPFLRNVELLAVPGIPTGRFDTNIAPRACATPATIPPPTPDPCTSSTQVDLNDPHGTGALTAVFGRPTAERIVAAQPHYDLDHTTRVAGVGPGFATQNRARLCITPPPIDLGDGTRYGWAYSARGGETSVAGFKLVVPPGVLDDPVGSWLHITPQTTPTPGLPGAAWPSAQFHIDGSWPQGIKNVYVSVPPASYAAGIAEFGMEPSILHYFDDGRTTGELIADERLQVDPGTGVVTAATNSLSIYEWVGHAANMLIEPAYGVLFGIRFAAPACHNGPWNEVAGTRRWTLDGHTVVLGGDRLDLPGNDPVPGGYPLKHCVQTAQNGTPALDAEVLLRNSTGTIQRLFPTGGSVAVSTNSGLADLVTDPIGYSLTHFATGTDTYLTPGATAAAVVPPGTFGRVSTQSDVLRSVLAIFAETALGKFLEAFSGNPFLETTVAQVVARRVDCAIGALKALGTVSSPLTFARESIVALAGCMQFESVFIDLSSRMDSLVRQGQLSASNYTKYQNALLSLREVTKILKIAGIVIGSLESVTWSIPSAVTIEHYDAPPRFDSQNRTIRPACLSQSGYGWVINETCQDMYYQPAANPPSGSQNPGSTLRPGVILRDGDSTRLYYFPFNGQPAENRPIDTGGLYLCLARHYPVNWIYDPVVYGGTTIFLTPPTCDGNLPDDRPLTRAEVATGSYLIREAGGRSWVVRGNGDRMEIPSGREFNCAVNPPEGYIKFYVWDQVPLSVIDTQWPNVQPYNISFCSGF